MVTNSGRDDDGTTTDGNAWRAWTGTASTATTNIWIGWSTGTSTGTAYSYTPARELSETERQQIEENRRLAETQKHEADVKAEQLLLDHLDLRQRRDWGDHQYFDVQTPSGRHMRVRKAPNKNVDEIKLGVKIASWCIVPVQNIPICDQLLMQKMMLDHHEDDFFRTAKKW